MREGKANDAKKKQPKGSTLAGDLFDALNPNDLLSNAQKVINTAVNVLEEEIAAGILAAKKIEKKVIDVEDIRDNPEDLMNRIRRDTHEAVDLFMDAIAAISKQFGLLSNTIVKETENVHKATPAANEKKREGTVAVIEHEEPLHPGKTAVLHMSVADDTATKPVKIQLQKTDFCGPLQQKILSKNWHIKPAAFILKRDEAKEITIHIKLPANCKAGRYNALLYDPLNPSVRTVIGIEVL